MQSRIDRAIALPAAASQQPCNVITLQRALVTGSSPAVLRAVAKWNERKSYDERRRKARSRHKAQSVALRAVADGLESLTWNDEVRRAA